MRGHLCMWHDWSSCTCQCCSILYEASDQNSPLTNNGRGKKALLVLILYWVCVFLFYNICLPEQFRLQRWNFQSQGPRKYLLFPGFSAFQPIPCPSSAGVDAIKASMEYNFSLRNNSVWNSVWTLVWKFHNGISVEFEKEFSPYQACSLLSSLLRNQSQIQRPSMCLWTSGLDLSHSVLSCPSPFGWLETCETVIVIICKILQTLLLLNLVEVADSHRGKVDFVQGSSGVANRDNRGLLQQIGVSPQSCFDQNVNLTSVYSR